MSEKGDSRVSAQFRERFGMFPEIALILVAGSAVVLVPLLLWDRREPPDVLMTASGSVLGGLVGFAIWHGVKAWISRGPTIAPPDKQ